MASGLGIAWTVYSVRFATSLSTEVVVSTMGGLGGYCRFTNPPYRAVMSHLQRTEHIYPFPPPAVDRRLARGIRGTGFILRMDVAYGALHVQYVPVPDRESCATQTSMLGYRIISGNISISNGLGTAGSRSYTRAKPVREGDQ